MTVYSFTLEIMVANKSTGDAEVIDLFNSLDDVRHDLIGMITVEQIEKELELEKPNRDDYEDEDDYDSAIEDYEEELAEAIEDYKDNMDFADINNFLMITNTNGVFNTKFSDFEDVENAVSEMENISDDDDWRAIVAIYNNHSNDLIDAIETFNGGDYYWYPDMNMEEVVEEQIDSGVWGELPDHIRRYLDIELMARDMSHDGYSYDEEANGVIAVF